MNKTKGETTQLTQTCNAIIFFGFVYAFFSVFQLYFRFSFLKTISHFNGIACWCCFSYFTMCVFVCILAFIVWMSLFCLLWMPNQMMQNSKYERLCWCHIVQNFVCMAMAIDVGCQVSGIKRCIENLKFKE